MSSMGIEKNYRTSHLKQEIIDSLIEIHIEESPILIWQNEAGKRNVLKAKIDSIDFAGDSISLSPFSDNDKILFPKLKSDLTFYIRGDSKNIVFKQEKISVKVNTNQLHLVIPTEVKLYEKRSEIRIQFKDQLLKMTTEIYPGGHTDLSTKSKTGELLDVSLSGMGFTLEKKYARLFFEKDKIKIDRIGNFRFPRPIYGEIIYTSSEGKFDARSKIGIRFKEKLTLEIINSI